MQVFSCADEFHWDCLEGLVYLCRSRMTLCSTGSNQVVFEGVYLLGYGSSLVKWSVFVLPFPYAIRLATPISALDEPDLQEAAYSPAMK